MKKIFLKAEFLQLLLYFQSLISKQKNDFFLFHLVIFSGDTYNQICCHYHKMWSSSLFFLCSFSIFLVLRVYFLNIFISFTVLSFLFDSFHCYFIPYFYPSLYNIWSLSLPSEWSTFYFRQLLFSYLFLTAAWQRLPWPFNALFSWHLTVAALMPNHHMWERF